MPVSKMLNVRLTPGLQKELMELSKKEKVSISVLVRHSIKEFLAVRKFKRLNKEISLYARKKGFLSEEDVLNIE